MMNLSQWLFLTLLICSTYQHIEVDIGRRRKTTFVAYAEQQDDVYTSANDDWTKNTTHSENADDDDSNYVSNRGYKIGFNQMVVMPLSCLQYNNGHMIKFNLYEDKGDRQCRSYNLGSYLISISHYMHAYFNYQAMEYGSDFELPWDAGYLNCVKLPQVMYTTQALYAKIGCEDHGGVSSVKLALHVYKDKYCSRPYDDGQNSGHKNGYYVNGYWLRSSVSFTPNFYKCAKCSPAQISSSFQKGNNWYDDDKINIQGTGQRLLES